MLFHHYLLIALGVILLAFLGVIIIRTIAFKPKAQEYQKINKIDFDQDKAISNLQELIKCKTISCDDKSLEDDKEFDKLIALLPNLYKNVYSTCTLQTFDGRALLFKWKGKTDKSPTVLMAHYDVVSVVEEDWQEPPFDGVIKDGCLWGRGTLDTKVTFNSSLFAVDTLIAKGFTPENDIYLAFSGGEEVNGVGAVNIVNYFKEQGIEPGLVLDEGGAVVENVFPGVKKPCALVGIAAKGMMNVKYTVKSQGGHASAPKPNSPIVTLSKTCVKLENSPFKAHLSKPVEEMFDTLGRHSNFVYRLIFANLWLTKGLLDALAKKSGGEMNALLRTTLAFTQAQGSKGVNVIPPKASITTNMRLNPLDNVDTAYDYLVKTVDNKNVDVKILQSVNPSRISRTDVDGYKKVATAIANTWGEEVIISPYLMVQCSDSRHYGVISNKVYRFSSMALTAEERATIHGNNEKIRLDSIIESVNFYLALVSQC